MLEARRPPPRAPLPTVGKLGSTLQASSAQFTLDQVFSDADHKVVVVILTALNTSNVSADYSNLSVITLMSDTTGHSYSPDPNSPAVEQQCDQGGFFTPVAPGQSQRGCEFFPCRPGVPGATRAPGAPHLAMGPGARPTAHHPEPGRRHGDRNRARARGPARAQGPARARAQGPEPGRAQEPEPARAQGHGGRPRRQGRGREGQEAPPCPTPQEEADRQETEEDEGEGKGRRRRE